MSHDKIIPILRGRPLLQQISRPPRVTPNSLMLGLLGALALVMLGFTPLSAPAPLQWDPRLSWEAQPHRIAYVAQLPFALFLAATLGPFAGVVAILAFLLAGLCFLPLFADGGGWNYLTAPGFGYLIGAAISAWVVGSRFHRAFRRRNQVGQILLTFLGATLAVLILHGVGLSYMLGLAMSGNLAWPAFFEYGFRLSVEPLPYDWLVAIALFCIVRPVRLALWPVLY